MNAEKLIDRIQSLISTLNRVHDIHVHAYVDQFSHMQRKEELKAIVDAVREANHKLDKLNTIMRDIYEKAYCRWRTDQRKVNSLLSKNVRDDEQLP